MYAASYQPHSERRRVAAIVLTLVAHALIVWLLLRLGPLADPPVPPSSPLSTFSVLPDPAARAARATQTRVTKARPVPGGASARRPTEVTPARAAEPTPPVSAFPEMLGGRELFEAADLGKMPAVRRGAGSGSGEGDAQGAGSDSVAAYGPGEGPGGQRLYNAQWQREPSSAELAAYLPNGVPPDSWAEIACRTVEGNQVDNCRMLGESPVGSGLARQMRLAAWQFRVLPPRIGGKKLVGAWVRIHISWGGKKAD